MKRSETIKALLDILDESKNLLPIMEDKLKRENDLTQDLLHAIELDNSYEERCKTATSLKRNRRDRRAYKDAIEEIEVLVEWEARNRGAINELKQTLGKLRKVEKYHQNRSYRPKVLTK